MKRKILVTAVLAVMICVASAAAAGYPEKTINMYCVFAPGGSMDSSARALSTAMEKSLGQPVVVVTKDGGAGTVGLSVLANDKPDGYTIAAATSTGIVRIPQSRQVTYKPLASFTSIYAYAAPPSGLVRKAGLPLQILQGTR